MDASKECFPARNAWIVMTKYKANRHRVIMARAKAWGLLLAERRNSMKRYYYAEYDYTVKESNPGSGFANAKLVVAFSSRRERDKFVDDRWYDNTARSVGSAYAWRNSDYSRCRCKMIPIAKNKNGFPYTDPLGLDQIIRHREWCNE
jgi:hypothetical protein